MEFSKNEKEKMDKNTEIIKNLKNKIINESFLLFIIITVLTIPFWIWKIDIAFSSLFWNGSEWYLKDSWIIKFFYNYGPVPAFIIFFYYIYKIFNKNSKIDIKIKKREALFIATFLLVGPGLLVNAIFKEYWGRPRPREIFEFKGEEKYIPPLKIGKFIPVEKYEKMLEAKEGGIAWDILRNIYKIKGRYNSFPAGHASIGFFVIAPYFILRKRKKGTLFLWSGIILGTLMGISRVAQGGHFLSDVIWAFGIIYFTGIILDKLILSKVTKNKAESP